MLLTAVQCMCFISFIIWNGIPMFKWRIFLFYLFSTHSTVRSMRNTQLQLLIKSSGKFRSCYIEYQRGFPKWKFLTASFFPELPCFWAVTCYTERSLKLRIVEQGTHSLDDTTQPPTQRYENYPTPSTRR